MGRSVGPLAGCTPRPAALHSAPWTLIPRLLRDSPTLDLPRAGPRRLICPLQSCPLGPAAQQRRLERGILPRQAFEGGMKEAGWGAQECRRWARKTCTPTGGREGKLPGEARAFTEHLLCTQACAGQCWGHSSDWSCRQGAVGGIGQ